MLQITVTTCTVPLFVQQRDVSHCSQPENEKVLLESQCGLQPVLDVMWEFTNFASVITIIFVLFVHVLLLSLPVICTTVGSRVL